MMKKIINTTFFTFSILGLFYIFYNFILIHSPYCDEVHAWNIAQNLNLFEIFQITKHEGHTFLWYLTLMPFAKFNIIGYPEVLKSVNFIIMLFAILFMWYKAPFNPIVKTVLTFSFPIFVQTYFARCYSLSVLILFIICSLYKDRLKHPIIYSILLILLANTNVMAIIGATALGIMFLYDIYKTKNFKFFKTPLLILLFGIFIILLQFVNFEIPHYAKFWSYKHHIGAFYNFNVPLLQVITMICHIFLLLVAPIFFKKDKSILFFIYFTTISLLIIFIKIYPGDIWHFSFLFLYLIAAIWIYKDKVSKNIFSKIYYFIFILMLACSIYINKLCFNYDSLSTKIINYIQINNNDFYNSDLYIWHNDAIPEFLPLLNNYNITVFDRHGLNMRKLEFYKETHAYGAYTPTFFNSIKKSIDNNKPVFIIHREFEKEFVKKLNNYLSENKLKSKLITTNYPFVIIQIISDK